MVSDKTTRYQITLSYSYILCVLIIFKYVSIVSLQSNFVYVICSIVSLKLCIKKISYLISFVIIYLI